MRTFKKLFLFRAGVNKVIW